SCFFVHIPSSKVFVLLDVRGATIVPTGERWDVVHNKRRRKNFSVQNHRKFYCSRLGDEDLVSIFRKGSIFRHEHEKPTSLESTVPEAGVGPPLNRRPRAWQREDRSFSG